VLALNDEMIASGHQIRKMENNGKYHPGYWVFSKSVPTIDVV
jgi:hypothetical protein